MRRVALLLLLALAAPIALLVLEGSRAAQQAPAPQPAAEIKPESVTYKDGEAELQGTLARDAARTGKRPAVLIVHDWMGEKQFERDKAAALASRGYVAFACDIYGKGVRPQNAEQARAEATKYYANPALCRSRLLAGLKVLQDNEHVDQGRIAVLGFCFGGTCALELARSGAEVRGAISFHGGLKRLGENAGIKAKVLVLHGADDPFVPAEDIAAFMAEMREGKVDWQFNAYGNAVHSFTNPAAGTDNSKGAAYNESADRRGWEAAHDFLRETLGE